MKKLSLLSIIILLFFACKSQPPIQGPVHTATPQPTVAPTKTPEPESPFESISLFISAGKPEEAIKKYEEAFKEDKENDRTKYLHSQLLLLTGDIDGAKKELNDLKDKNPENIDAAYSLALIEGFQGNKIKQKELLEQVVKIDSGNANALASLGEMYLEDKQIDKAQEYFDKSLNYDQRNYVALIGKGNVELRKNEYDKAKATFDKAVEQDPENPYSYSDRAMAKRGLKDDAGAISDLDKALELDPENYWAYIDRGKMLIDTGKREDALSDFSKAIEIDPKVFIAYVYRGGIYYEDQMWNEMALNYLIVKQIKPEYFYIYEPLGIYYYMEKNWEDSLAMFKKAFEYQNQEYSYPLMAALCLKQLKRTKEIEKYLLPIVKNFPDNTWHYHMYRYYINPDNDYYVTKAADQEKNKALRARIIFYIASQYMLNPRMQGAAVTLFNETVEVERKNLMEYVIAKNQLKQLGLN